MIGQSIYEKHKNTTQQWLPTDDQWRWAKNSNDPVTKKQLDDLGWTADNIKYTFNSHGFRADEFTDDPGIMFLGCSLTIGIGMDVERSWTNIVSKHLNLKNWNLGQGGGSTDTCFRLAYHWLPILKPKYVCVLMPFASRKEMLTNDGIKFYYPQMLERGSFYDNWLSVDENASLSRAKNTLAIQKLCADANIPLVCTESSLLWARSYTDLARDLAHPGIEWNARIAEHFIENIKRLK